MHPAPTRFRPDRVHLATRHSAARHDDTTSDTAEKVDFDAVLHRAASIPPPPVPNDDEALRSIPPAPPPGLGSLAPVDLSRLGPRPPRPRRAPGATPEARWPLRAGVAVLVLAAVGLLSSREARPAVREPPTIPAVEAVEVQVGTHSDTPPPARAVSAPPIAPSATGESLANEDSGSLARSRRGRASRAASASLAPRSLAPAMDVALHPDREQVRGALAAVASQVAACAPGHGGQVVPMRISVRSSGRVTTAVLQDGPFDGTSEGSCMARAVRSATFPRFSRDGFVVDYPFRL